MDHAGNPHHGFVLLLALALLALYVLPIRIAYERQHPQRLAITVLTLLLGWTLLGWIGALVWACIAVAPT
jgi:RsiW-degrading membrane proteinase PrsW (M82 family)